MNTPEASEGEEGEIQRTTLSDMAVATLEVYLDEVFQRIPQQGVGEDEVRVIYVEYERLRKIYTGKLQDFKAKRTTVQHLSAWYLEIKAVVGQKVRAAIVRCDPNPSAPVPFLQASDRIEEAFQRVELAFKRIRDIENELEKRSLEGAAKTLRGRLAELLSKEEHRKTDQELINDLAAEILITSDFNRAYDVRVLGLNRQAKTVDEFVIFEFTPMSSSRENFDRLQRLEKETSAIDSYLKILHDKLTALHKFHERFQALQASR